MNNTWASRISGVTFAVMLLLCLPSIAFAEQERTKGFALPPLEEFIYKWQKSGGYESGASQMFITELCVLLGVPKPDSPRPELADNTYVFEMAVERIGPTGRKSIARIDLWLKGRFIWESKQGVNPSDPDNEEPRRSGHGTRGTADHDTALFKARIQAQDYAPILPEGAKNPPFVIVADIGYCLDIYADFRNTGEYTPFPSARENRIFLEDLRKPETLHLLYKIWTDPLSLDPSRESEKVIKNIALKLSALAKSLEQSGHDADTASLFLMRCIFVMFAEDCGLLPHGAFTKLLEDLQQTPEKFAPTVTDLWAAMQTGGASSALGNVLHFSGSIFKDAHALALTTEQIAMLHEAATANWAAVETGIFGTLLEQALSPQERHKLGAHYTPTAYVERVVVPTVMDPEREKWEQAKDAALAHVHQSDQAAAIAAIEAYYKHLTEIIVLDPSCGCANFLAVSLNLLKDLEGEIVQALRALGLSERDIQRKGYYVGPHQFRGIEIVPRAADIAELVLWISYLQRHYTIHGNINPPEPILRDFRSIECRDAVLAFDDQGEPIPAVAWPEATYIVGNPPFTGNHKMREYLGNKYTEALRKAYPELPKGTEYVLYWWHRAANLVREGKVQRFGLITTNSITQVKGRKVVEYHMNAQPPLSIVFAVPDHPWMDDKSGPDVRIAITVGALTSGPGTLLTEIHRKPDVQNQGEQQFVVYFDRETGHINSNLTIGVNVNAAKPLRANEGITYRGASLHGSGFIVTPEEAKKIGLGSISGLERHIRPYHNGRDIAGTARNVMVIDLYGLTSEEVKRRYPLVYEWILEKVKPIRDRNNRATYRKNWWIFGEPRSELRPALAEIKRYIITPESARRRYFVFLNESILPDNKLIVITSEDAYTLGVLSSKIHCEWALATGGRLGVGNDPVYVKSLAFDAFPFPNATKEHKARIRAIAEAIDAHRKQRQELHPKLTLTNMYAVMEDIFYGVHLTPKKQTISDQGDIPALFKLHQELDAAVADAYGWPVNLPADEILSRLLELNKQRAVEEKSGTVRWLRPEYQNPISPNTP